MNDQQREQDEGARKEEDAFADKKQSSLVVAWIRSDNAIICMGVALFLALFFLLRGHPFGFQIATLSSYTFLLLGLTFAKARFSLRRAEVRSALPLLALLHGVFLAAIYRVVTYALESRSHLPVSLLRHGKRSPSFFYVGLGLIVFLAFAIQLVWTWRILNRRIESAQKR